jgi:hypothetical protein
VTASTRPVHSPHLCALDQRPSHLPAQLERSAESWDTQKVAGWLRALNLTQCEAVALKTGLSGMDLIELLTETASGVGGLADKLTWMGISEAREVQTLGAALSEVTGVRTGASGGGAGGGVGRAAPVAAGGVNGPTEPYVPRDMAGGLVDKDADTTIAMLRRQLVDSERQRAMAEQQLERAVAMLQEERAGNGTAAAALTPPTAAAGAGADVDAGADADGKQKLACFASYLISTVRCRCGFGFGGGGGADGCRCTTTKQELEQVSRTHTLNPKARLLTSCVASCIGCQGLLRVGKVKQSEHLRRGSQRGMPTTTTSHNRRLADM